MNLFGGVTCGQSYSPQCAVTAGSGPSAGTPASTGTQAGGQPAAGTAAGGGGAAGGCSGTENKTFGCVPAGCQVTVQTLACPIGAPRQRPAGAGAAPPDPAVLAALARQTLGLPSPVIRSSPAQDALQLTNLPTWLWINPAEWVPESKTATVPGESVTATATPVSVTWHPGDGSTVTCQGAGTPYTSADNPASASPDCGHTYTSSSAGQPGGAFQATATITWDVTWRGRGRGRGAGAAVHDRRGGVPGRGVPGAEHQRRDLTPAGRQRGLPARAGTAPAGKTKAPSALQARAGREKRRSADHRRATARTGGKAAPGISQVHERTKKGTSQVYRTPVTAGKFCPSGT